MPRSSLCFRRHEKARVAHASLQEAEFLSRLAAEGKDIFSIDEAQAYWPTPANTANVLSRLVRKGWLQRLDRGVYMLLPLAAGPERTWTEL
jgi:predicted transcriptional regulator of viral defense system